MTDPVPSALRASPVWFTLERNSAGGRACRDYTVRDAAGVPLVTARAFNWQRDIVVADRAAHPILILRRSRLFALSGRVAVLETGSLAQVGSIRRNGTFYDAAGRWLGRFRDARSARSRTRENLLQGVFDAIVGSESVPSGPDSFVLEGGAGSAGKLTSAPLPFAAAPAVAVSPRVAQLGRWLPARVRHRLRTLAAPRGWKLEHDHSATDDARLLIAAALFAIELSRW